MPFRAFDDALPSSQALLESLLCARHIASPLRIRFLSPSISSPALLRDVTADKETAAFPRHAPENSPRRHPPAPLAPHAVPCAQHSFLVLTHRSLRFTPFSCSSVPLFVLTARTLFSHYPIIIVVGYGALTHVHHWPLTFPRRPLCAASRVAPCAFPCSSASLVVPAREPSSLALRHSFGTPQAFLRHSCSPRFSLALPCRSLCAASLLALLCRSLCSPHELSSHTIPL